MDKMDRLTYSFGFYFDGEPINEMKVVDMFNDTKAQLDKLKSERLAHYHNEIKKLEAV